MFFSKKPDPIPGPPVAEAPAPISAAAPAATRPPEPARTELAPDEIKKRAMAAKHVAASFGEIVTLMMRSAADKSITLQDLEWMVVPALQTGQFAVAEAQSKDTGAV